jgi:leucyl aminopeptidase
VPDLVHIRRAASADALARDLVNTPAQDMGPADLAAEARSLADRHGAQVREVVGEALLTERLQAIHAVGRAGPRAPRLIDLCWGDPARPKVTVVGKGVCFDTGGLDLKPAQGMALMKKDMGGAAMALGLAHMVMEAGLPVRLRVLLPAVENSVAGDSYRPGDVLTTRKGLRVEVGNTDAEGRLILCDALALADEERPDLLIDLATLTGAARVALGPELPAVFSPDEDLVASLELCGRIEGDPLWHMPLWAPYDEDLSSKFADVANVATHAFAGSVMAALFLRRFVSEATRWAHVDLFAWNTRERPGRPVGAESQAIRAVYRLIASRYHG